MTSIAAPLETTSGDYSRSNVAQYNNLQTYNVTPEGGQGADLSATETDTSLCLSALNGQAHDRVTLAASTIGVRRLTPTECERLQGLPDGWTLPGPDSKRYAGLGDAVTANVAEWIGRRLIEREARA